MRHDIKEATEWGLAGVQRAGLVLEKRKDSSLFREAR